MLSFCSSANYVYGTISAGSPYPKIVIANQADPNMGPISGTLEFVAAASPVTVYGMNFTLAGSALSYFAEKK